MYVEPDEIRMFLNIDSTALPDAVLSKYISMAEGYVDRLTDTCWNGKWKDTLKYLQDNGFVDDNGVLTVDPASLADKQCFDYEVHDLTKYKGGVWWGAGIPVYLGHRFVRKLVSLKLFNGSEYEEWIGEKTEARNIGDYWVDYWNGVVYINVFWYYQGGKEVTVAYLYGRDDLPWYIKELTMLYAIKYVLMFERRFAAILETSDSPRITDMLGYIDERLEYLESMARSIKVPRTRVM